MCQQAAGSAPYIETPLFVSEDQTDAVVMQYHSGVTPPPWTSNAAMASYAAAWRQNMTADLAAFARKPRRGVFSPSCWNHCGNKRGTPLVDGVDVVAALGSWVEEVLGRTGNGSVVHSDDCVRGDTISRYHAVTHCRANAYS